MPGKQLLDTTRAQIVVLHQQGVSNKAIAARFRISPTTVSNTIKLHESTSSFSYPKRSGRPRITSTTTDRAIVLSSKKNPFASSTDLRQSLPDNLQHKPSSRTIRRRLVQAGLSCYRPAKKPALSKKNIKDRLAFAKRYQHWTVDQWRKCMFSDETTISQHGTWVRHVRRPANKRHDQRYTIPTVKNPPKVMVWGAISAKGRCGLWFAPQGTTINSATYLDILKEKLPIYMASRQCNYFQHDGAPCHQARVVRNWLAHESINVLGPWPGNSPDLNCIENCWVAIKKKVSNHRPTSYEALIQNIKEVWVKEISPDFTDTLISSMPARLKAVIENKGGSTKY